MAKILSLLQRLASDVPSVRFSPGTDFHWSPATREVWYDPASEDAASLLHETAHAILGHQSYRQDIDLVRMERDAWAYTVTTLAPRYGVPIDDDQVEAALESYREWLHARSLCPGCDAVGLQTGTGFYRCPSCLARWRSNDARTCGLRRYSIR